MRFQIEVYEFGGTTRAVYHRGTLKEAREVFQDTIDKFDPEALWASKKRLIEAERKQKEV